MTDQPKGKEEDEWEAEDDARSLMRMGDIMKDEKRHARAQAKMDEMTKSMEMMKQVGMNYKSMQDMGKK